MPYDKICKYCGTRLSEFYHTSMLGCPECYNEFKLEIKMVASKMHGKTKHVGKNPNNQGVEHELLFEYRRLQEEKEKALLEGRFDDMVKIGNELKLLSEELYRRGLK